MKRSIGIPALILLMTAARSADAGLTIGIPNQNLSPNQPITSAVTISGSTADLNSITGLYLVFDITPDPSNRTTPVASLQFVGPTNAATDPTLNDTKYLFYGQSSDADFPASPFATVTSPPGSGGYFTKFIGNDYSDETFTLTSTTYDLADLQLTYSASRTTNIAGDLFDITLDPSSTYDTTTAAGLSFANDPTTNKPPQGQVLVSAITTVPEPGSLRLGLVALSLLIAHHLWSRRV